MAADAPSREVNWCAAGGPDPHQSRLAIDGARSRKKLQSFQGRIGIFS